MNMPDDTFEKLIARAMDELPQQYMEHLDNVAITYADDPTPEQLTKQRVGEGQILLGLYEGIPQTQRGAAYSLVLPDKITLFKNPIVSLSSYDSEVYEHVKRTLWHEIAHHYGLDHGRIHELEQKNTPLV